MRDWLPPGGVPASVKQALQGCVVGGGGNIEPDPDWGEPGLTAAEKIYGWNGFIVLAMTSGRPENPVNARRATAFLAERPNDAGSLS